MQYNVTLGSGWRFLYITSLPGVECEGRHLAPCPRGVNVTHWVPDHLSRGHRLKSIIPPPPSSSLLPEWLQERKMTRSDAHLLSGLCISSVNWSPFTCSKRLLTDTLTSRTLISLWLCLRSARVRMRTHAVGLTHGYLSLIRLVIWDMGHMCANIQIGHYFI